MYDCVPLPLQTCSAEDGALGARHAPEATEQLGALGLEALGVDPALLVLLADPFVGVDLVELGRVDLHVGTAGREELLGPAPQQLGGVGEELERIGVRLPRQSLFQKAPTSVGLGIVTFSGLLVRSFAARYSSSRGDEWTLSRPVTENGISTTIATLSSLPDSWNCTV